MNDLIIAPTSFTPEIRFLLSEREFLVKGRSLPEDAPDFYHPVFEWLKKFSAQHPGDLVLTYDLEYFNTSSAKMIIDIIWTLKKGGIKDSSLKVIWNYAEHDDDMKEVAEHMSEITGIDIETRMHS